MATISEDQAVEITRELLSIYGYDLLIKLIEDGRDLSCYGYGSLTVRWRNHHPWLVETSTTWKADNNEL